jgi:colanic acid biosynthesis glycosyl transferase WcaI
MRVALVSCVFPPEPVVSSRTSFDLARELSARGHDVTVICPFPSRPGGRIYRGYRRSLWRRETSPEGFRVVRCFATSSRRSSLLSRLAENVSFGLTSALALLAGRKPEVVYANTWPLFAASMTTIAARLRHVPVVLSIQDIYPESLISQRRAGGGVASRLLLALDRWIVRRAAAVVVISERFAEQYRRTRGVQASRIHVVPNWLSVESSADDPAAAAACRDRHRIPRDAFLLVYGGNISTAAGVETMIEAIARVERAHFLIAGEGAAIEQCRRLAAQVAPGRVHFESPWTDTMGVLRTADAVALPTRAEQSAVSVPSKLISYLFSARAVLAVAMEDSDTAATILGSGAGVVVPPGDIATLASAIRSMMQLSSAERQSMGQSGQSWAMAHVTPEVCLPRLVRAIEEAAR